MADVFDHVTIRVSDLEASSRFYEQALAQLGYGEPYRGDPFLEWEDLSIASAGDDRPATRNLHLALVVRSRADVDGWWRAMTAAGHPDDLLGTRQRTHGGTSRSALHCTAAEGLTSVPGNATFATKGRELWPALRSRTSTHRMRLARSKVTDTQTC